MSGFRIRKEITLLNGERVKTSALLTGLIGLVLLLALVIGLLFWTVGHFQTAGRSEEGAAGAVEPPPSLEAKVPETAENEAPVGPLAGLLRSHREVIQADSLESLAFSGTYRTEGVEFDFELLAKRPGLFRQSLRHADLEILGGFDAKHYWQKNPLLDEAGSNRSAETANRTMLILESSFNALVWQYEGFGLRGLRLMGLETHDGRICHVVRNKALVDPEVLHYIDRDTFVERLRTCVIEVNGVELRIEIEYDYSTAVNTSGPVRQLPGGYDLRLNGAPVAEARFDSIRANIGVMTWVFERP